MCFQKHKIPRAPTVMRPMGYKPQLPGMQQFFETTEHPTVDKPVAANTSPEPYRIFKQSGTDNTASESSHYLACVRLDPLCRHELYRAEIPPPPCNSSMSFGPTIDSWIGFETSHKCDFNYTGQMNPLPDDNRCSTPQKTVYHLTPAILTSVLFDWVRRIRNATTHDCSLCS